MTERIDQVRLTLEGATDEEYEYAVEEMTKLNLEIQRRKVERLVAERLEEEERKVARQRMADIGLITRARAFGLPETSGEFLDRTRREIVKETERAHFAVCKCPLRPRCVPHGGPAFVFTPSCDIHEHVADGADEFAAALDAGRVVIVDDPVVFTDPPLPHTFRAGESLTVDMSAATYAFDKRAETNGQPNGTATLEQVRDSERLLERDLEIQRLENELRQVQEHRDMLIADRTDSEYVKVGAVKVVVDGKRPRIVTLEDRYVIDGELLYVRRSL